MNFNILYFCILIIWLTWFSYYILGAYLKEKNKMKYLEIKNKRYELYSSIDPKLIEKEIDELIKKELDQYVLINFISSNTLYIPKPEIEKMIIKITVEILNNLSDLYIFYIECICKVKKEEDVQRFIKRKVQDQVLGFTVEFNKTMG